MSSFSNNFFSSCCYYFCCSIFKKNEVLNCLPQSIWTCCFWQSRKTSNCFSLSLPCLFFFFGLLPFFLKNIGRKAWRSKCFSFPIKWKLFPSDIIVVDSMWCDNAWAWRWCLLAGGHEWWRRWANCEGFGGKWSEQTACFCTIEN